MITRVLSAIPRPCQGAPSTIRCIKTGEYPRSPCFLFPVREHPAPPGALRREGGLPVLRVVEEVREHPAPTGAFRPEHADVGVELASSQGATNTIRCIKTGAGKEGFEKVREHPAPSGALKRARAVVPHRPHRPRQGAPSTIRCIKTRRRPCTRRFPCRVREPPAPSGAFMTLLHRSRSWSSIQVPSRYCGGASCGRAVSTPPVPFRREVRTQGTRIRQRRSHTRAGSSRCVRCCVA
mgnify:FL=1